MIERYFLKRNSILILSIALCGFFLFPAAQPSIAKTKKSSKLSSSKKSYKKKNRKKRRRTACNAKLGKKQALELLQLSSPYLCSLVDLRPVEDPNASLNLKNKYLQNDGEEEWDPNQELIDENGAPIDESAFISADAESFRTLWLAYVEEDTISTANAYTSYGLEKKSVMKSIMAWLGSPYLFGGTSRRGVDCSAFVLSVMQKSGDFVLPRTAASQYQLGKFVRRENMKFGDLVFFHTRKHVYVSHVGIYLGDNLFAHSSSRFGVTVSSLESSYYNARLIGVKRLSRDDVESLGGAMADAASEIAY